MTEEQAPKRGKEEAKAPPETARAFELVAGELGLQAWELEAVKAHTRWPEGKEVTRSELERQRDAVRSVML